MQIGNIIVEPLKAFQIKKCEIYQCINELGSAKLYGIIEEGKETEIEKQINAEDIFKIILIDKNETVTLLYAGIITYYEIKYYTSYSEMELKIESNLLKLNQVKKNRVFQAISETYENIIKSIGEKSKTICKENSALVGKIGHMSVQYEETDWEYLKRLTSEKNSFLVPDFKFQNPSYCIGMPITKMKEIFPIQYKKQTNIENYQRKLKNKIPIVIYEETVYIIKTRDILQLCDFVKLPEVGIHLYVYQINGSLQDGEYISEYILKPQGGFSTIPIKNYNIIGASIMATVTEVQSDRVKVEMDIDGNQENGRLFDFATIYSSKDNAGWFCMPEVGDHVRVYFPDEKEEHAFVFNAMHIQKEGKDPSIKFFRNPQGKEIIFAPTYLKLTNNQGLSIKLEDKDGISIESNQGIIIKGEENIHIQSIDSKVIVESKEGIEMSQGNSKIEVNKDINMTANQIHMQESY